MLQLRFIFLYQYNRFDDSYCEARPTEAPAKQFNAYKILTYLPHFYIIFITIRYNIFLIVFPLSATRKTPTRLKGNLVISQRRNVYVRLIEIAVIVVVSALVYLPNLSRATIYRDDWYYTMDRLIGGPGVFQEMFQIDRPARGPLFEIYYQLFGTQPLPYHLCSYLWRLLSGLGALWLFNLIWPNKRQACLYMALFFTLYPGYLRWMEGFEDQPQILSVCLEVFSFALTIKAIQSNRISVKICFWLGAIFTGWAYIALVDFAIGMEFFRLLCVVIVVLRKQGDFPPLKKTISIIRTWAPAILIPAIFLSWRLLFFHNERAATDLGLQLSYLENSPVLTGLWWLVRLFQSTVNTAFLAWTAPLFPQLFVMRLTDIVTGVLTIVIAIAIIFLAHLLLARLGSGTQSQNEPDHQSVWQKEAILVGLSGVIAGLIVVIIANRYVMFEQYSHYTLPASLASATLLVGLVFYIANQHIRLIVLSLLVGCAVLTHYVVSVQVVSEEGTISHFWQQVAWRAPGIRAGTTLVVSYPGVDYGEDIDAVAGPANFIYYPQTTNQIPVVYQLSALAQIHYSINNILTGGSKMNGYRTHLWTENYDNILVISQPTASSCVHVIDGQWPLYSSDDQDLILIAGARSRIENVITDVASPVLAEYIFGPEPAHTWCYYFEKGALAIQQGDWQRAVDLGNEAIGLSLHPIDRVEWMPFLQANATLGNEETFRVIAVKMGDLPFDRLQACDTLNLMREAGFTFSAGIQEQMSALLCFGHP
jgi:hypothetical protein